VDNKALAEKIFCAPSEKAQKRLFADVPEAQRPYVLCELRELSGSPHAIRKGMTLLATDDTPDGLKDANAWIKQKDLTSADIRLFKSGGFLMIEAIRDDALNPQR